MAALFERIKTGLPGLAKRTVPAVSMPHSPKNTAGSTLKVIDSPYASITIDALVSEVGVLSPGCVLIGACDDRVHFYMDLQDPRPGSVLIVGRRGAGQARLLQSILSSAVLLNSHRQLRFALLSNRADQYREILHQPHCYRAISPQSQSLSQVITQMADLAERRMQSKQADNLLILAIDGLDGVVGQLDDQAFGDLAWLIRNSPSLRIWPFVTLEVEQADVIGEEFLDLFGTYLLGNMDAKQAALFQGDAAITSRLVTGKQYCVWFDQEWLNFWVPEPVTDFRSST